MVRLGTNSDTITLEYDDRVQFRFTPDSSALLDGVGEYIRDSTTVNIIDNDCICFSFITYIYTVFLFAQCWRSTSGNLNLYSRRALLVDYPTSVYIPPGAPLASESDKEYSD